MWLMNINEESAGNHDMKNDLYRFLYNIQLLPKWLEVFYMTFDLLTFFQTRFLDLSCTFVLHGPTLHGMFLPCSCFIPTYLARKVMWLVWPFDLHIYWPLHFLTFFYFMYNLLIHLYATDSSIDMVGVIDLLLKLSIHYPNYSLTFSR